MRALLLGLTLFSSSVFASNFAQVDADLAAYDRVIAERRAEFSAQPAEPHNIEWVQAKLDHMYDIDQYMRTQWGSLPRERGYSVEETQYFQTQFLPRFEEMDRTNTADIKSLLMIYDWFRISAFGDQSDNQAWILVQHADLDPDFQKDVLKILERLYPLGETSRHNFAYLYDRVAASWNDPSKRQLQRYGTQVQCIDGTPVPIPLEDPEHVDERRADMGLKPLNEYLKDFEGRCG